MMLYEAQSGLKTSQLAVKMALRGAKMAISGVLKSARAYAHNTGFYTSLQEGYA